ncbi:MAG: DUF4358 domain-containing protein [Ruminococcaceae bacterium]|nr:DUF4358 domain-containing protein [Oscillospiraceae bacterium]
MKKLLISLAAALLLGACAAKEAADVSDPAAVYGAIAEAAELSDMFALTADDLLYMIGIEPEWYTASAAYMATEGTSPEEILIFRAADQASADQILEILQSRLQYKQDSAAQYLTENQGILKDGVVRADGLTVSLIVTKDMEAVLSIYP